jgi:hypothetical protein
VKPAHSQVSDIYPYHQLGGAGLLVLHLTVPLFVTGMIIALCPEIYQPRKRMTRSLSLNMKGEIMESWKRAYERGFALFPIVNGGKIPVTPHGFKDATRDLKSLEIWFSLKQNIGIRTGQESYVTVVDLDPDHIDGFLKLFPKCLEETYVVKTGRGYHLYYQYVRKLMSRDYTICDIKNDAGYVIGAGSVHPNGTIYEVLTDAPIALMSDEMKFEIFKYHPKSESVPYTQTTAQIWDLVDMSRFKKDGSGNYRGPHPAHDSESGTNFLIESDGRFWHCWRHGCSGGRRKLQRIINNNEVCR